MFHNSLDALICRVTDVIFSQLRSTLLKKLNLTKLQKQACTNKLEVGWLGFNGAFNNKLEKLEHKNIKRLKMFGHLNNIQRGNRRAYTCSPESWMEIQVTSPRQLLTCQQHKSTRFIFYLLPIYQSIHTNTRNLPSGQYTFQIH